MALLCVGCTSISTLPDTDIYLADLDRTSMTVSHVRNVTQRTGYDNQPAFTADGNALLFVSDRSGSTDVYRYDILTSLTTQITDTRESEFSPTPMTDGKSFSAIRVGLPDDTTEAYTESQQLWRYDLTGKPIAPILGTRRVGYHCWLDDGLVALFIVGDDKKGLPHRLVATDLASRQTVDLASNIGRTIKRMPDGRLSFVDKSDSTKWMFSTIAQGDAKPTPLIAAPLGSEDFCWLQDGTMICVRGNTLVQWKTGTTTFTPFATLADLVGTIVRITVNDDDTRIAFVLVKPPMPSK
ncbi:MAG: hypothetical protein NTX15_10170 [Candidatus Kapabacteria bacterium]|nr:hypothetical protein [Candidatus Kapabacteria bacterium]